MLLASHEQARETTSLLESYGDRAAHHVLERGIPEQMGALAMLPATQQTAKLSRPMLPHLPIYYHPSLELAVGNYTQATGLLLGAAASTLDSAAVDRARRLVDNVGMNR